MHGNQLIAGLGKQSPDLLPLGVTDLHRNLSIMFKICSRTVGHVPVRIEAIRPNARIAVAANTSRLSVGPGPNGMSAMNPNSASMFRS